MSLSKFPSIFRKSTLPNGTVNGDATATSTQAIRDVHVKKGSPFTQILDPSTISSVVDAFRHKESLDDRKFALEHALTFISRTDEGPLQTELQNKIVELLYNDLGHPPATSIGNHYAWRTADGSFNNIDLPEIGKAGTPYARSVQQSHPLPKNQLPDPGLIFDTLLKREGFEEHPAGLSSLMFSFAALVIHTVFRTSHRNVDINETSSYVDLSPLYGHNQEAQDKVRVRDGRGLLLPDVFAEDRLLLLPPAVCALLVLFSRNHNYIAKKLLDINERGTYVDPSTLRSDKPAEKAKLLAQEEELFQIARLINCGWFASVVFSDYFSCILGLVRTGSSWSLDPFQEIRNQDHSVFERGKGNACSVEFNCLYRWHATTSVKDEEWVAQVFEKVFDGKDPEAVTPEDFKAAGHRIAATQPDITHWTFGDLQRQADGTFKDEDLASLIHNATEHPAGAFRARGTPAVMRLHEIMGIEQNRRWGVCSLNDFRKFLGLRPYKTFKEWNPRPDIAEAAEKLYGDIDHLELYVGLQAEDAKPVMDGAGLCPGYTISRAILSDAIALTRGDRFFTQDYSPHNLTAWGFADCQRDPNAFGFGSTLGRLFLRNLPNNFTENSVYTFFPLMTPDAMKTHLSKLKLIDQYDFTRPKDQSGVKEVNDYAQVTEILSNPAAFVSSYAEQAARVINGKGFYTAQQDTEENKIAKALADSPEALDKIGKYFYDTTSHLIKSNSFSLVGDKVRGVDIVRDVFRVVPILWAAADIGGIELKTKDHPDGAYTPSELYDILGDIYTFVFLEIEPANVMVLGAKVRHDTRELLGHIKNHLYGAGGVRGSFTGFVSSLFTRSRKPEHHELVKRLSQLGQSSDDLATNILALLVSATVELSLALTNMINLYLGREEGTKISSLIKSADGNALLDGYAREALRLDPPFQGVYRVATKDQEVGGVAVKKNDRVFLDIASANVNESVFESAHSVNPSRGTKGYLSVDGLFVHLGEMTTKIMTEVLRAVYGFENVRRAPRISGELKRFKDHSRPQLRYAYLDQHQRTSAWPTSLTIQYDVTK